MSRVLLGIYVPGATAWHRCGVGWKYLVFAALVVPAAVSPSPWLSVGLLLATLALVASTGASLRVAWTVPVGLAVLLGALAAYHAWSGSVSLAVTIPAAILVALYASRLILFTTPIPALVDALVVAVTPLRRLGVDPERFGLAVAILLRSVPVIAGAFGEARDAARARGIERNPLALVAPVVVHAVAFAASTGQALAARGLGEDRPDPPRRGDAARLDCQP